ncbi:SDR family oxidoreductase [Candidatus Aminicenantes bacterium AC-708-M15]|jgi:UDP-glucose 4-epimerase|nr:SDR family oxidoreductase [SCandidatus Aminicenantes bacterium Aminicenantia_JdfR_composite]MCP2596937.1 SDR family oxidoreductase [Candidatus Aminicenantes bacterium AC-335-G13]MCP2603985.1 SDR family oxidoreductase [Candidatus Aminicenantes bacterium AC-708-M15]
MAFYLVTGGAGFIGSNIVRFLIKKGERVRVLDNFLTGKKENLASISDKIELIEGDIRHFEICLKATEGVDYVLHQAALPSVPRSVEDPLTTSEININGTLNILLASLKNKIKRVVYASSSSIYGDSPILPKREEMMPSPLSPYAITKLTGEYFCKVFYQIYGLETVILRYFNVFGPYQDPASQYAAVIPKFIKAMLKGEKPVIYGDGEQSRDFTYVDNVVIANILSAIKKDASGKVFNIATQKRITINELVKEINSILKTNIEPEYAPPRPGDIKHSLADITAAKKILGYDPEIQFREGLEKTVNWFKNKLVEGGENEIRS